LLLLGIYKKHTKELVKKLTEDNLELIDQRYLYYIRVYSTTLNTPILWKMIIENLSGEDARELHVENATVVDCGGVLIKPVFIVIKKISVFIEGNYSK
jgi:hypothetical protein